jgi:hypothetical protein
MKPNFLCWAYQGRPLLLTGFISGLACNLVHDLVTLVMLPWQPLQADTCSDSDDSFVPVLNKASASGSAAEATPRSPDTIDIDDSTGGLIMGANCRDFCL